MNAEKPSLKAAPKGKNQPSKEKPAQNTPAKEIHGYQDQGLLEPTRYGDWDVKGRCSDF